MNTLQLFPEPEPLDHEFCWFNDRDNIVVAEQCAIAVYRNPNGDVVIRQKAGPGEETDSLIVVQPGFAGTLARKILSAASEAFPETDARDQTAALRQRRYRERHRNGVTTVTSREAGQ